MQNTDSEICANLWHTMDVPQLNHQQSLVSNKLGLLQSMPGNPTPSIALMTHSLQDALDLITAIINSKVRQ